MTLIITEKLVYKVSDKIDDIAGFLYDSDKPWIAVHWAKGTGLDGKTAILRKDTILQYMDIGEVTE